jgi:hypothetical protein
MFRILHIPSNTFLVKDLAKSFLESLIDPDFVNSHNIYKFRYQFHSSSFTIAEFSNEEEIEIALGYLKKRYPSMCLLEFVIVEI